MNVVIHYYCLVDVKDCDASSQTIGAYFEAKIVRITKVRGACLVVGMYVIQKSIRKISSVRFALFRNTSSLNSLEC